MAVDALRVEVLFAAIDKLTSPLKGMAGGSKRLAADLAATRKEITALQRAQGSSNALRKAEADYAALSAKLDTARAAHQAYKRELGDVGQATAAQTRKLEQLAAAEAKAGKAYTTQGDKLQRLSRELEGAGVDVAKLGEHEDRLAMKIYEANKRLDQQTAKLAANEKAQERAQRVRSIGGKIAGGGAVMSAAVSLPAFAFAKDAFDVAGDAVELQSTFDTTFGKMSGAMNKWAVATGNAMGRSTQEMQKGANTFGIFFNQVAPAEKAADMSKKFATLAQDLGSFFNTDTQTAVDKLRSGLSGEAEPLRDFGVFLNEAAVKAKLLEMKIKPVGKEFTDQQKIMARYQLILEATTKAQGDVARTAESPANRIRRAKGAYEEMQVAIGQQLVPALVPLIVKVTELIERFNNLSPATQKAIVIGGALAAAIGPILMAIGGLVATIGFALPAITGLGSAFGVVASIMGGGVARVLPLLARLGPLFLSVGSAVARAGMMMLANPMVLAVTAIVVAIGAAGYLIYRHWDTIKGAFASAGAWIMTKLGELKALFFRFPGLFGPLGVAVAFVIRHWSQIRAAFGAGIAFLMGLPGRMLSIGANIIQGLINGVVGRLAALKSTIVNAASSAATWFKQKLGIHSPSRVFFAFGGNITDGLQRGIAAGEGSAVRGVDRLSQRVAGAFAASSLVATPAIAAVQPIGARAGAAAAASSSATAAPAGVTIGTVTVQIVQQPGEDAGALARRFADELTKLQATGGRSSYDDDD